jgi:hypothetical protein
MRLARTGVYSYTWVVNGICLSDQSFGMQRVIGICITVSKQRSSKMKKIIIALVLVFGTVGTAVALSTVSNSVIPSAHAGCGNGAC